MCFIGVEVVEQETSAPPPKKNPGSAHAFYSNTKSIIPLIGSWYKYFNNGNSSNLLNHTKLYQLQQLYPTTPNYTKVTLLSVKLLLAVENGES